MPKPEYARRVDKNQASIAAALRAIGVRVKITSGAGDGFPDLTMFYRGGTYLAEVKDGDKPPSERRLTPDQIELHDLAMAGGVVIPIFKDIDDALAFFGAKAQ